MLPTYAGLAPPITALVLGSQPIEGQAPHYMKIPGAVPGSRIIAVDEHAGDEYPEGWEFCPAVIGRRTETRPFYRGESSLVSSLYEMNWPFLNRYSWAGELSTAHVEQVETIGLDEFTDGKRPIHFLAADIQGAEGEAFESGTKTLADVLMVQVEVGYSPIYLDAPLWRDIDAILGAQGFGLYHTLGGAIRPEFLHFSPDHPSDGRWMWGEAVYVRDDMDALSRDDLLRFATLAHLYDYLTLAASCLHRVAGVHAAMGYLEAARAARKA